MKWNFVNVCIVILTIHLLSGCMPNYIQENISSEDTIISSNVLDDRKKVDFEEVKEDLVGGYCYADESIYSYNYLFFENGDYIIIDYEGERYTQNNSTVEYFLGCNQYEKKIIISLTREDGKQLELYTTSIGIDYDGAPVAGHKMPGEFRYNNSRMESKGVVSYDSEIFKDVEVGKTTRRDLVKIAPGHLVYITPIGDVSEYPLENGRYLRVMFDEELIVQSIEVVDSMCEVCF